MAALTKEAVTLKGQRLVKFNKFAVGRLPPSPTTGICHCGGAPRGVGTSWARVYSHRNHICKEANVVTVSVGFYLKKPIKKRPNAKGETTPKSAVGKGKAEPSFPDIVHYKGDQTMKRDLCRTKSIRRTDRREG